MKHTYDHPLPAVTVDMVIFTIRKGSLRVLTIKRRDDPFKDQWALPGGYVHVGVGCAPGGDQGESLEEAAERELLEETGLQRDRDKVFLEQLYTFGTPGRDPRGRVITVAYYALVSPEAFHRVEAGDDATEAQWMYVMDKSRLKPPQEERDKGLAFDHDEVLRTALERIRGKIDYDPRLVRALLPEEFTVTDFRQVHLIVKGDPYDTYDRSNFSKRFRRMVEDGHFVELEETKTGRGRPARLYKFPDKT